jgi:hypothetical protein
MVIILLQRHRVGLFSGRENVNSQLSDDECRAVEEKQSAGRREDLHAVIVESLGRVNRGDSVHNFFFSSGKN